MNNYAPWWNCNITVYNMFKKEDGSIEWYSTQIEGAFYQRDNVKVSVGQTLIQSDSTICRIRVDERFKNPREWKQLSGEDKKLYFTLSPKDIIVNDHVDFIVNEYHKGQRSSDLLAEFRSWPGCFTIETVTINVGGERGNEHYLARGI